MKKLLLALFFSMFITTSYAAQLITLPAYFAASCDDYTGSWEGTLTDLNGLFNNDGPWPITVNLHASGNKVWGRTSEIIGKDKKQIFPATEIWAQVDRQKLVDIFWGKQNQCGMLSQQGALVSKNLLLITINWESPMTGTTLLMILQRKNNLSPYYETEHINSFNTATIQSCH
jgi:hypothetical protein